MTIGGQWSHAFDKRVWVGRPGSDLGRNRKSLSACVPGFAKSRGGMNISELSHISRPLVVPLRKPGALERLTAIVGALVVTAGLFLYAGGWFTPHALTPAAIINTFECVNGVHPGFRRNHAKGVCVTGYFESNGQGQALSKALIFPPGRVPIVGRFALAGGQPYAADTPQTVRSLAILFKLPDGEEWRTGDDQHPRFHRQYTASVQRFPGGVLSGSGHGKKHPRRHERLSGQTPGNRGGAASDRQVIRSRPDLRTAPTTL